MAVVEEVVRSASTESEVEPARYRAVSASAKMAPSESVHYVEE